jgi:DNA-binding response OmpR family regulator
MADNSHILVVEDNLADVFLIRDAIKASGVSAMVHVVHNGEDAIRFFDSADSDDSSPRPELVILDINLPKVRGKEVLERLRQSRRCRDAFVIVASTSDTLQDRKMAVTTGTNIYFRKPSEYDEFMKLGILIRDFFPHR